MLIRWAQPGFEVTQSGRPGSRLVARTPDGALWIALWVAVAVAEVLALRPVLFDREAPIQGIEVVFTLVGGSFAACGLLAWRRRPDSRSGPLMVATGFLFFVQPLLGQLDGELGRHAARPAASTTGSSRSSR